MDLSGKLIIKARLGNDIRRIPIHNEDLTYDELILMMQRVFRGTLRLDEEVTVKYADDAKSNPQAIDNNQQQSGDFKKELIQIRNQINNILDNMGIASGGDVNDETVAISVAKEPVITAGKTEPPAPATASFTIPKSTSYDTSFDPLTAETPSSSFAAVTDGTSAGGDRTASPAGSLASMSASSKVAVQPSSSQIAASFDMPADSGGAASTPQTTFNQQIAPPTMNQPTPTLNVAPQNAYSAPQSLATTSPYGGQMGMPSQPTTAAPPAPTQNYTGYAQTAAPRPQMPPAATQPQVPPAVTQPPQSQMPSQGYPQQQQYPPSSSAPYGGYNTGAPPQPQPQPGQPKQPQAGYPSQAYPSNPQQGGYPQQMMSGPPGPQQGYMGQNQQNMPQAGGSNPHRLFGGRGYRPRQPGPGYQ